MASPEEKKKVLNIDCPCCGSKLSIDAEAGVVTECQEPVDPRKSAELKDAAQVVKDEASRIHDRFRQIVEADKGRGAAMEQKFKEFMDKAKDEPAPKPVRDIDLD